MNEPVTVIAPIKLAPGKTEADLIAASNHFQEEFVSQESGVLRRELVRKNNNEYLDIIQFRSQQDADDVIEKEKDSAACHAFFAVMDMSEVKSADEVIEFYTSLATYT